MPTQMNMEIDEPEEGNDGTKLTSPEEASVQIKSPPQVKRASGDIASTPGRNDNASDEDGTNHVTPAKEEQKSARGNKAPKRTKVQSIESFFVKRRENKEELCKHNAMTVVAAYRTEGGTRLVPAGSRKKTPGRESKEIQEGGG